MKTFYNIGPADKYKSTNIVVGKNRKQKKQPVFHNCIEKKLSDNKIYLLVPLSEISRVYEIPEREFLTDCMLDILNDLSEKQGYKKLISIDNDKKKTKRINYW